VTERLYYTDPYLRRFEAQVVGAEGNKIYLDRTAFYPASGGQPHDLGLLGGVAVAEVVDEDDRIAHILAGPASEGAVQCEIDWGRRFDHMQQHSGQHLLSAVLVELFGIRTLSFHLGSDSSTIDVDAVTLDADRLSRIEERANEIVFENRPVTIAFASSSADLQLRKPSERDGELRIVSIDGLDRSACGGTHVRSTAEIGPIVIRKLDKIRGNVRIEFLCGGRAVRRARADFQALLKVARLFSAALDDTPDVVSAQQQRLFEVEKAYKKLSTEAAEREGRDLYAATGAGMDGIRRVIRDGAIDDRVRIMAQVFTAAERAVFIAFSDDPPAVLMAASKERWKRWRKPGAGAGKRAIGRGSPSRQGLTLRLTIQRTCPAPKPIPPCPACPSSAEQRIGREFLSKREMCRNAWG
jgi:alanyl-tRNA synthetase